MHQEQQQRQQQQQQQLLVFGGFSGKGVDGSLWMLQQQEQSSQTAADSSSSWSVKQVHAGADLPAAVNKQQSSTGSTGSCKEFSPVPRFAHAAACLADPDQPYKQVRRGLTNVVCQCV